MIKKLRLALAALLLTVSSGAFAQDDYVDVTSDYLTNAGLTSLSGWTLTGDDPGTDYSYRNYKSGVLEYYHTWTGDATKHGTPIGSTHAFSISQKTTLPAGDYQVKMYGFYREGEKNAGEAQEKAYLYAGENKVFIKGNAGGVGYGDVPAAWANNQRYLNELAFTLDAETEVEIGFNGYIDTYNSWALIGPFSLYKKPDPTEALNAYNAAFTAAQEVANSGNQMSADAESALTTAISSNTGLTAASGIDALVAAATALNNATSTANTSVTFYANNKAAIDARTALVENTNVYTQATCDEFTTKTAEYLSAWAAGTLTETVVNPNSATGHRASTAYNFLLTPWTIGETPANNWDAALYINTWSTEGANDGSNFLVPFYEYWTGDGNSLGATALTATINTGKAKQNYAVTAWTRVRIKNGATGPTGITLKVGDAHAVSVTTGAQIGTSQFYIDEFTAYGTSDADGNLTITYDIAASNNISWLSFKNVKYTEVEKSVAQLEYEDALAAAEAITPNVSTGADKALTDAIAAAKETAKANTDEAYQSAATSLNAAVVDYNGVKPAYDAYWVWADYAETFVAGLPVAEESAKTTYTTTVSTQNTTVENAPNAAAIETAQATLIAAMKAYVAVANPNQGETFDVTKLYLINPDLTGLTTWKPTAGWYTDLGVTAQVMQNPEPSNGTGKEWFYEIYSGSGPLAVGNGVYQKATLPAGAFRYVAWAFSRGANIGGVGDGVIAAFAGTTVGASHTAPTMTEITAGFELMAEQEIKMGLYIAEGNKGNWAGCGYMQLLKTTETALSIAKDAYNEALPAAEAVDQAAKMGASELTALQNALATTPEETAESYQAATEALNTAASNATASIAAYASLNTALAKFVERPAFAAATAQFTYRATAEAGYNNATFTATEATNAAADLKAKYREYLRNLVTEYKTATAFVTNADISVTGAPPTGWEYTTEAGNKGTITQNNMDTNGTINLFENWKSGGLVEGNMFQTVTGLPNGWYFVKMVAFTRNNGDNDYIYIKTATDEKTSFLPTPESAQISVTDPIEVTDGTVEIGLHIGSGADWAALGAVQLYAFDIADETRTTALNKLGTICLPFNATVNNAALYTATLHESGNYVELATADKIEAGKAYIYEATAANPSFSYSADADFVKEPANDGILKGTFVAKAAEAGQYIMQTHDDGVQQFYQVEDEIPNIPAYRAYIQLPEGEAKSRTISIGKGDDGATGIDAVLNSEAAIEAVYGVNGELRSSLQKGFNILKMADGTTQKVFVK